MDIRYAGGFQGERPIINPRALPAPLAQVARNVYLRSGTLKPERAPVSVDLLPNVHNPGNLYRYPFGNNGAGFWFSWNDSLDIDVVRAPIANDAYERVYWTGDGPPKMGGSDVLTTGTGPYPGSWYQMGVPAPSASPTVSEPTTRVAPTDDSDWPPSTAIETSYVVTCITRYGEQGPPSPTSPWILRWDDVEESPAGGGVVVNLPSAPGGNSDITTLRIHRVESGGEFQFVADVPVGTATYTDNVASEDLGDVLPSLDWDMPDPAMRGLTAMGNGMLAGFFGNTLAFCEAYYPHAWPTGYRLAFPDDIVSIAAISGGLVVATTGQPWLVVGTAPAAMSQMQLDAPQSCVSKRSMVDMGGYALYASPDGLVAVGGNEAQVVTQQIMSREQWQALRPETIHAYRHDGRYLAFYEGGCFAFTPGEGFEFFDQQATGGYYDTEQDRLYLIQNGGITAWGEGEPMAMRWRSPITQIPPGAAGFSCGKIVADAYPITFRLIADGETVLESQVVDREMFRLPAGYTLSRDWELEVEGYHEVFSVHIATSPTELV